MNSSTMMAMELGQRLLPLTFNSCSCSCSCCCSSSARMVSASYKPHLLRAAAPRAVGLGYGVCSKGLRWQSRKLQAVRAAKPGSSVDAPSDSSSSSPPPGTESAAQSHLELLERMTQNSTSSSTSSSSGKEVKTIREQLSSQVEPDAAEEVAIPLSNLEKENSVKELTISQKRNIRRQDYMNRVSERNDAPFFAAVAAFVLLPPICILGFAVATGYVELFP